MLLITVDSGNLLSCSEHGQVVRLAELTVTSGADIYTMDVADNDICFYPSSAGTTASETPMDALLAEGHDPYGDFIGLLKEAGIAVVPNFRVNDHHGSPSQWTAWEREHIEWSLGQDTGAWRSYHEGGRRWLAGGRGPAADGLCRGGGAGAPPGYFAGDCRPIRTGWTHA